MITAVKVSPKDAFTATEKITSFVAGHVTWEKYVLKYRFYDSTCYIGS